MWLQKVAVEVDGGIKLQIAPEVGDDSRRKCLRTKNVDSPDGRHTNTLLLLWGTVQDAQISNRF